MKSMLCDKGKLIAGKSLPCKYFVSRTYFTESGGTEMDKYCNNGEIYGFAEDTDNVGMIMLGDKVVSQCSNYKPKVKIKARKKVQANKSKVSQKKG